MSELTSHHQKAYGQWAGNEAGTPADPERCAADVYSSLQWRRLQCTRKRGHGPEGAFCKQHDPAAKAAREAKVTTRHKADMIKRSKEWWGPKFLAALEKIAAGHNDPQALAREVISEFNQATACYRPVSEE